MQTPMPAQLEYWLNIVNNKKASFELRSAAILHLTNIRDTIDKSLKREQKFKNENMFTR
jgi:hypothetical protein